MNIRSPLQGQIALVTGGAKGYGLGIATELHQAGARVFITGRDQAALDAAVAGTDTISILADATSPADWDRVIETVLNSAGRIDILVNNAGSGGKDPARDVQTDESINDCISLNLTGSIYGCCRVAPLMRAQGSGIIVNISSICARHSWPERGVYSAAKAGLSQFSKSLYLELRPHGVRVSTVTPSWGVTGFTDVAGMRPHDSEAIDKNIEPAELGKIIADLCTIPPNLCMQETILWPPVIERSLI